MNDTTQLQQAMSHNIGRLLLRMVRSFNQAIIHKLHDRGHVKARQGHTALVANLELDGITLVALAQRAGITKQRMGQMVKELEQEGYLMRKADQHDRRAWLLLPTERGMQLLLDVQQAVAEIEADYAVVLGKYTLQLIKTALFDLIAHLPELADEDESKKVAKHKRL